MGKCERGDLKGCRCGPLQPPPINVTMPLQIMFTYAPFMESFFDTRPLSLAQGAQIVAVGVVALLILEIEKWVQGQCQTKLGMIKVVEQAVWSEPVSPI